MPRAVTRLLIAAMLAVAVALIAPEPWRSWAIGAALVAFGLVATWRLSSVARTPRDR
ncbi:MAG: hypothetical protein KGM44_04590 [bacterium]|nr:hypothetical protein [bacterium]